MQDLLMLVPRRYLDYSSIVKIRDLKVNDEITTIGAVRSARAQRTRTRGDLINVVITDESGSLILKWFNRPDLRKKFKTGDWLLVSGKVSFFYGKQLINPLYELIAEESVSEKSSGSVIPIYPLTEGLSIWDVRRCVKIAIDECLGELEETLPAHLLKKRNLLPLAEAIKRLHFPMNIAETVDARRRLVYEEFFFFELALARRKALIQSRQGVMFKDRNVTTAAFLSALPFNLTQKQQEVIRQIVRDMEKEKPMNRLLQGDVGAGKTVIALYAMLVAVDNGYQAALMAPTEILAEQHFIAHGPVLKKINVSAVLLTSSLRPDEKERTVAAIESGDAHIVFGTHALIEENIAFKRLGMAIVDEQHRFGVMQRAALVNKAINPDFLVLSATPIPRTLSLTLYGDLDVSILDEKPPGRGAVVTRVVSEKEKSATFRFINQQLALGRQMFVICPVIEQSEKVELRSVNEVYEEIKKAFPDFMAAVIHGRLRTDDRLRIMEEFRQGKIKIMVATTVIEVGVDIPNATVMLIEHPERFGLAQLHQLRGRIGRGSEESYCFLFLTRFVVQETYERISFFAKTNDGFILAKKDMKLRGPGEILGKKQHGLPDIKIGDLEDDELLLFQARDDAFALVESDPETEKSENYPIKRRLQHFAERENLLRIG